jgi:hypothetical protein
VSNTHDTRPWYVAAQQDGTHPFRPAWVDGECGHCMGDPDAAAHRRFLAEREQRIFNSDMVELAVLNELVFAAIAASDHPILLPPPCMEIEMALSFAVTAFCPHIISDTVDRELAAWRAELDGAAA